MYIWSMNKCNYMHKNIYMGQKNFHTKTCMFIEPDAHSAYITQLYMYEHIMQ